MLYSVETWILWRHQATKLLATVMDLNRRVARISRQEKIGEITQPYFEIIEEKLLKWFGHLMSLASDGIKKLITGLECRGQEE